MGTLVTLALIISMTILAALALISIKRIEEDLNSRLKVLEKDVLDLKLRQIQRDKEEEEKKEQKIIDTSMPRSLTSEDIKKLGDLEKSLKVIYKLIKDTENRDSRQTGMIYAEKIIPNGTIYDRNLDREISPEFEEDLNRAVRSVAIQWIRKIVSEGKGVADNYVMTNSNLRRYLVDEE